MWKQIYIKRHVLSYFRKWSNKPINREQIHTCSLFFYLFFIFYMG